VLALINDERRLAGMRAAARALARPAAAARIADIVVREASR
jgi:UDP-N-acetylglucosamine:LPS N-acetylglucosamine transferase